MVKSVRRLYDSTKGLAYDISPFDSAHPEWHIEMSDGTSDGPLSDSKLQELYLIGET